MRTHFGIRSLRASRLLAVSIVLLIVFGIVVLSLIVPTGLASGGYWYEVRSIEAKDLGMAHPAGLAFSPAAKVFFTQEGPWADRAGGSSLVTFTLDGDRTGSSLLAASIPDPLNVAFYRATEGLYFLDQGRQELVQMEIGPGGDRPLSRQTSKSFNARPFEIQNPQGISFDPDHSYLYILDAAGPSIVRITADTANGFDGDSATIEGRVKRIGLGNLGEVQLKGLAINPSDGHLFVFSSDEHKMYELGQDGQVVSTLDLAELNLGDPQGMVFAPSGDPTDDPAQMSLYIADSGSGLSQGRVVELSLAEPALAALPPAGSASIVHVIDTSAWSTPSTDPMGIDWNPLTGNLVSSDSEMEEAPAPYWHGKNVFEFSNGGSLVRAWTTWPGFSDEPSDVAVNPDNGHIFFSDDNAREVFEVNPGPDGICDTADDTVTSFDTRAFDPPSTDPEGIAYGGGQLFISDGLGKEVYVISPGVDGLFGTADDQVTHFDTLAMGLRDPEGVGYDRKTGTLFIVSAYDRKKLVETTVSGEVLSVYDTSGTDIVAPSGVAIGPGSQNPAAWNVYISARGIDNGADPYENDGKVYELTLGKTASPAAPDVFLPVVLDNAYGGWTTGINISNTSASPADVQIVYYNGNGKVVTTDSKTVPANGYWGVYQGGKFGGNWAGSAVVLGSKPVAVTVNEVGPGNGAMGYTGDINPSTTLYLPVVMDNAYGGWTSGINIKNTSSSSAAVTISYYNANGSPANSESGTIKGNGYWGVYQGGKLSANWAGSAVITSNQPIVAVVNEVHFSGSAISYNAFTSGGNVVFLPMTLNNAYGGWTTGANILNTSSSPASGSISYFNSSGSLQKSQPISLPPRGYIGLYQGSAGLPPGFAGSAVITMNQPVAAVVNNVPISGDAMGYDGVINGATQVSLPVVMDNAYGGWTSGTGIQNTTSSAATVNVHYYDTNGNSLGLAGQNIPAHGYWGLYQGGTLGGRAGSAQITSSQPIAAIVNEINSSGSAISYNALQGGDIEAKTP